MQDQNLAENQDSRDQRGDGFYREFTGGGWFKSKTIKLDKRFLEFLEDENMQIDEVVLAKHLKLAENPPEDDSDDGEWDDDNEPTHNSNLNFSKEERFPDLNNQIQAVIDDFGAIFLKFDSLAARVKNSKNQISKFFRQNLETFRRLTFG